MPISYRTVAEDEPRRTELLVVRVTEDQKAHLQQLAQRTGGQISEAVRELIAQSAARKHTAD